MLDAVRNMVNRYELSSGKELPTAIAVTSALPGEGVTTVSQALATLLAHEFGAFVCWIDCQWLSHDDIEQPDGPVGLIDVISGESDVLSALRSSSELPELMSLHAGHVPANKRHMIVRSAEFERLTSVLVSEFDHVIFDIPPVLTSADGLAILRRCDAHVFVVKHHSTSTTQVREALAATAPTTSLGVVLNHYQTKVPARIRRLLGE